MGAADLVWKAGKRHFSVSRKERESAQLALAITLHRCNQ